MTILNATILSDRAIVVQDLAISGALADATGAPDCPRLAAAIAAGSLDPGCAAMKDAAVVSSKVTAFPDRRMVVGSVGNLLLGVGWRHALLRGLVPGGDIDAVHEFAPRELRRLREYIADLARQGGVEAFDLDVGFVLHVGWSERFGLIGRVYEAEDDFAGREILPGRGHFVCPGEVYPRDPEYAELCQRWVPAAIEGEGLGEFHRRLAANQYRGWRAGAYPVAQSAISEEIEIAEITRDGVTLST